MNSYNSFNDIFEEMKKRLTLSSTAMSLWIEPLTPLKLNNNVVQLYVQNDYTREMSYKNFKKHMEDAFSDVLGFDVEVEIFSEKTLTPEQIARYGLSTSSGQSDESTKELQKELEDDDVVKNKLTKSEMQSNYQHTFDTFIVGDTNKLAYSACKSVVDKPNPMYNPLYIYSEPGLGKTHLLSAVKAEMLKKNPNLKIIYTTGDIFTEEFVKSIRYNTTEDFKKKHRYCDMLLIDDIHSISNRPETQQELFNTFNFLRDNGKPIIFTSDRPPKDLIGIEERLISRFEWGLLADIAPPEYETRVAIIKRKAELYNMKLPDNIIEFLADKLKTNIRLLEGAITKINALTVVTGVTPTLNIAQNVVRDVQSNHEPIPVTVEKIINEVSKAYSVTPADIKSENRASQVSTARQVCVYLISKITGLSYSRIGEEVGRRDHSTIVYSINKVKSVIAKDPSFKAIIDDMIKNLSNNT